jgi:hypothetical protein
MLTLLLWGVFIVVAVRGWQAWKVRLNNSLEEKRKEHEAQMSATDIPSETAAQLNKDKPAI